MTYFQSDGNSTDYNNAMVLPRQLAWSSKTRVRESHLITIKPGSNQRAILDVARASNGEMIFTFATGDKPNNRMLGVYELTVEIAGKINGNSFQSVEERFRLDFRGGDSLVIKKIEDEKHAEKEQSTISLPPRIDEFPKVEPKPETKKRKPLKTEYIVAIIGAAATIIAGILSSPYIGKLFESTPTPTATTTFTVTSTTPSPTKSATVTFTPEKPTLTRLLHLEN